ncbi:MAG TPA: hypothetical protein VGD37_08025 [Kofleriaceae bacterium]|jgi:hypothetical protein
MVRIRHGWLVVMLGLGLLAACKKDDKSSPAPGGDKTAETSAQGGAATGDDLSYLPVDSELVLGMNVSQLRQSSLWKQFVEPKLMTGETQQKLAEFKAKCGGYDMMNAVRSASLGLKNLTTAPPTGVVVVHGLDKTKTLDCIEKNKGEIVNEGGEVKREGDVLLLKDKRGQTSALSFLNDSTLLVGLGDNATAAGMKAVAAGGSTLKSSPKFLEMYKKVNTGDSLWLLVNGRLLDKAPMGMKARAVFGSINVTSGLGVDLRVQFESPDQATQAAGMLNGQAKQAQAYVDKAEFTSDGAELHASVMMSQQKLQALISQLGGLLGAFAGGMGNTGTP